MAYLKSSDISGVGGEEEETFEGVSTGQVCTPVRMGKRARSISEGSPEHEKRKREWIGIDLRGRVDDCNKIVEESIVELKTYIGKNFSKERHETFFMTRFDRILEAQNDLASEYERISKLLNKVLTVEERIKSLSSSEESDFNKRIDLLEAKLIEGIGEKNKLVMEKIKAEVERNRFILESDDAQRQGDIERIEGLVKAQKKELETIIFGKVKPIQEDVATVIQGIHEVAANMNLLNEKVVKLLQKSGDVETIGEIDNKLDSIRQKEDETCGSIAELKLLMGNMGPVQREKTTYADITRGDMIPKISVGARDVRPVKSLVVVRPPEGVMNTKEELVKIINPVADKLKIKNVRRMGSRGVLLEAASEDDVEKVIGHPGLIEKGFKMDRPGRRVPRILIYDVDKNLTEQEIVEAIILQNESIFDVCPDFKSKFKLKFKSGRMREDLVNWVAEVSPEVRTLLRKLDRLFIGWRACRVQDFVMVSRCYKCQMYGHVAKYCRQNMMICGHCGEDGHEMKTCPKGQENPNCVLCKRAKKPCDHSINSRECPAYVAAVNRLVNSTDYGA